MEKDDLQDQLLRLYTASVEAAIVSTPMYYKTFLGISATANMRADQKQRVTENLIATLLHRKSSMETLLYNILFTTTVPEEETSLHELLLPTLHVSAEEATRERRVFTATVGREALSHKEITILHLMTNVRCEATKVATVLDRLL